VPATFGADFLAAIEIKRKFGPQIGPQFLSLHTKNG
jgi:hypothetical protein